VNYEEVWFDSLQELKSDVVVASYVSSLFYIRKKFFLKLMG